MAELNKSYDPKLVEDRIYQYWLEHNYFHAKVDPDKKPYCIVMPPPNITGQLHIGHALDNTLQDILIRWRRMQGYEALWLPGTDHASIATEAKIVEAMRKEGLTKEDLGREKFLERAWAWKKEYGGRITKQFWKLGVSCDWERERFTMDEGCSNAVKEVFVNYYNKGLIYRGNRMVNWCPKCGTSISDAEVEYEAQNGNFWHILYPVKETGEMLEIATTRPETMLGDTAVAINVEDERYKHLHGCHVILPLLDKEIPIVCDEHADMEKGTGVVKITPAHDPNDFEVGLRHSLPIVRCFTYDGHMTGAEDVAAYEELKKKGTLSENEPEVLDCGKYAGMTTMEARKAIVADLTALGLLKEIEPLSHDVGTCYRCHTTIEPMVSKQWFVKMAPLAKPAIDAVRKGETQFIPKRSEKIYFHWLENIRDWCISRQLWWGHRIPAYYCEDCGEMVVSKDAVHTCPKCGGKMKQDEDTLDTWFSSALWPFSTLGWPENTEELKYFYPTDTLVTGYDIIFFWVVRMMFSGLHNMGAVPFRTVFIHGLIRDELGRKMSKSLGNGVDPIEVIDKYGADALRFFLATGNSPGNDMRFSESRVESCRNFANKLYNASRFVLMNIEGHEVSLSLPTNLKLEDQWILSTLNTLCKDVTENLEKFELGIAVQKLYDFIWDCFCDWYIELKKTDLYSDDEQAAQNARQVLVYVLDKILKLLHPFMPFITEEIWQNLPHYGDTIMLQQYPEYTEALDFTAEAADMQKIMTAITAIRTQRNEMNVPPSKKAKLYIATKTASTFEHGIEFFKKLASASEVEIGSDFTLDGAVTVVTADAKLYIPMNELVDREAELKRLNKELEQTQKMLRQDEGKLSNPGFMGKAPAAVIEKIQNQAQREREKIALIQAAIENLQ
ncbi:MAG: valine--tRNA ligase [Ruminococcus sp.]|nr:valine--tRNA ligase [Ruminococcus sp.]